MRDGWTWNYAKCHAVDRRIIMINMITRLLGLIIAAFSGAFYFAFDNVVVAVLCMAISIFVMLGWFDNENEHKKSVK